MTTSEFWFCLPARSSGQFLTCFLGITVMAVNTSQFVTGSDCHILDAQFVLAAPVTASQNGVDFFPYESFPEGG